jgi:Protein of unknown function (DUF1598)
MARRRSPRFAGFIALAALLVAYGLTVLVATTRAQTTSTTGTTSTTSTGTTSTATTATGTTSTTSSTLTTNVNAVAGIVVDANGVLRTEMFPDLTGQLARQRLAAARAALAATDPGVVKPSTLRKISLNRLEAALKQRQATGLGASEEMKYLAGLTRLQFVFYYPDTKDIVIAGPAEGWMADPAGRVRALSSLRPVIELDDLVTALRAFPPLGKPTSQISCSIDPTSEGLQKMQQFLRDVGSRFNAANASKDAQYIVAGLKENLGPQDIHIRGIPADTHFAQVLVEADYRMKLIGIGLEHPPVRQLMSWVDRVNPGSVSRNALQRWYFVPNYECVKETADDLAMELVGNGVKLVNADEVVAPDGTRAASGSVDGASRAFTEAFTKRYAELAAVSPVYSQLRNCIDLAVAAAFIQANDYYGKSGWSMPILGNESDYHVQTYTAPQQVDCMINVLWRGNTLMTPIGGGVTIQPRQALAPANLLHDDDGKVGQVHDQLDLKNLKPDQWWWD